MAAGATHVSAKFVSNMTLTALASLWASDTVKAALITNAITPAVADSDPRWGAGGSQNYSTAEVSGAGYSAGGVSLAGTTSTLASAVTSLNCTSPITFASAPTITTAYWVIFYDSTDAGKHVFGYMDLAGPVALTNALQINVNGVSSGTQPVFQGTAS
jgi:hypothetical protein